MDKAKLQRFGAIATKFVGDPTKMRMTVLGGLLALAVGAVYMPLSDTIDQSRKQLDAETTRFETIKEVESLRRETENYLSLLSRQSDTNEWVQFLLAGSRQTQVRLRDMESKEPQKVGPYKAVSLAVELEGTYPRLKAFVEWLEQSDRLLRVESIRFERQPGNLVMKVYVLGLVRKNV